MSKKSQEGKRIEYIPISCDFSCSALNLMFDYALKFNFGLPIEMIYKKDFKSFPEWGIEFEKGAILSKGQD